jgi:hypothetical protein
MDRMPEVDESELVLVVANGGIDDASLVVEQPDGQTDSLPMQPCSSHSDLVPTNRAWRLEVGSDVVVSLRDVTILAGVPLTVYRVIVTPAGTVDVSGPEAADRMPDAPIGFACAAE